MGVASRPRTSSDSLATAELTTVGHPPCPPAPLRPGPALFVISQSHLALAVFRREPLASLHRPGEMIGFMTTTRSKAGWARGTGVADRTVIKDGSEKESRDSERLKGRPEEDWRQMRGDRRRSKDERPTQKGHAMMTETDNFRKKRSPSVSCKVIEKMNEVGNKLTSSGVPVLVLDLSNTGQGGHALKTLNRPLDARHERKQSQSRLVWPTRAVARVIPAQGDARKGGGMGQSTPPLAQDWLEREREAAVGATAAEKGCMSN